MPSGRSLLPVFGLWVVWVYLLSLVVLRPLGHVPTAPLRPTVRFVDADEVHVFDPGAGPNGLREVVAELSEPFDREVEIPVTAIPVASPADGATQAQAGVDYTVARDAVFVFPANETRGHLRERASLLDVTVTPDPSASEPRRFRLQLDGTEQVVVAPDPLAFRTIEIPPGSRPVAMKGNPAHFRESLVDVNERDFLDHRFVVDAKRPPEEDAELQFSLYRIVGTGETPVQHFSGRFPKGASDTSFSLRELVPAEELERIGAAYDPRPGIDEWYELHLDARPPLISAEDPCLATIFCRDRDGAADVTFRVEDENGDAVKRVLPDKPFWVTAELSKPIEVDCPVTPVVDGKAFPPGGVIPAGRQQSNRMGPYRLPATEKGAESRDDVLVSLAARPDEGRGGCRACGGKAGGCAKCRGKCGTCGGPPGSCPACESACKQCGGRPGGCASCRAACKKCGGAPGGCKACKPVCGQCGGRKGGCAACGNGSGVCSSCGGKPGGCGVCGGGGPGGGGPGGGGPGGGGPGGGGPGGGGPGGGGGKSPVSPPPAESIPLGPPVPGDFMVFLVNNQRLHEPGDVITDQVREAIKDRNPYKQGVIVINGDGKESLLTEKSDPPAVDRTFEPFSRDQQDLGGQAEQVVETVARKRKSAEKPNIRTLVIWPEREFVSASSLDVFKALANDGRGPISFLCPDADPERARELAAALAPEGGDNAEITVRSPKSTELVEHIDDVLDTIGAAPGDTLNRERTAR
jgi:hypothetical protein